MAIGKQSKANMAKVRQEVYARDFETCIVSSSTWAMLHPCFGGMTLQHSVKRGMGSSAKWDGADFLRVMCAGHNALAESDAAFAKACIRSGWAVPRWVAETTPINRVPVLYADGWHLLDGGKRFAISDNTAIDLQLEIYGD